VSGWNDFFRPVSGGTRLIGIGTDDEGEGHRPAVSLYDITDLQNPTPLLARAQAAQLQWSWSEASYDHRAFSVLENAVSVTAADGMPREEEGVRVLPLGSSMYYTYKTPTEVFAQAFFHSNGWPEQILFEGGEILISASRYGIHRFDAGAFNLLSE
jgi:hypothetical protein